MNSRPVTPVRPNSSTTSAKGKASSAATASGGSSGGGVTSPFGQHHGGKQSSHTFKLSSSSSATNNNKSNDTTTNNNQIQLDTQKTKVDNPDNKNDSDTTNDFVLDVTRNANDGSIITTTLRSILHATCDSLYQDLYDMTNDEIPVVNVSAAAMAVAGASGNNSNGNDGTLTARKNELTSGTYGGGSSSVGVTPASSGQYASASAHHSNLNNKAIMEKMPNLSFSRRRHEVGVRVARHGRAVSHLVALVRTYCDLEIASDNCNSSIATSAAGFTSNDDRGVENGSCNIGNDNSSSANLKRNLQRPLKRPASPTPPAETALSKKARLAQRQHQYKSKAGEVVKLTNNALRHVHESWREADEAQDALYFHHGELWRGRRHCHDVLGALHLLSSKGKDSPGRGTIWIDMPTDLQLVIDRYEISNEKQRGKVETIKRLRGAVRRKLVLGEAGVIQKRQKQLKMVHDTIKDDTERYIETTGNHGATIPGVADSDLNEAVRANCESDDGNDFPWKVLLEKNGGAVRLSYGEPRGVINSPLQNNKERGVSSTSKTEDLVGDDTSMKYMFPIEARLTVLSEDNDAEWTLLSIDVRAEPRTGESSHQLEPNNRQKFDLHRLCARSMASEELRVRTKMTALKQIANCRISDAKGYTASDLERDWQREQDSGDVESIASAVMNGTKDANTTPLSQEGGIGQAHQEKSSEGRCDEKVCVAIVAKPLSCLFGVAHTFAMSLYLEVLSSQAIALKRGVWGTVEGGISVTPVHYYETSARGGAADGRSANRRAGRKIAANSSSVKSSTRSPLAGMAIHFWSCDDRYGSPTISALNSSDELLVENGGKSNLMDERCWEQRLSLCIEAFPGKGLLVSISGGENIEKGRQGISNNLKVSANIAGFLAKNVDNLLRSIRNPFNLSAADAILAATALCAHMRAVAVVKALTCAQQRLPKAGISRLPGWMELSIDNGSIVVSGHLQMGDETVEYRHQSITELFRVCYDCRTGRSAVVFPYAVSLLRVLACNDVSGSDIQLLRTQNIVATRRNAASLGKDLTGRIVKDAFDGMSRSMDILSSRTGVGERWNNIHAQAESLRDQAIEQACYDVRLSLMICCGMSAVYGVAALALGVASGTDPLIDAAGPKFDHENDFIDAPPLGIVLNQYVTDKKLDKVGGEQRKSSTVIRDLFAVSGCVNRQQLSVHCVLASTEAEKPTDIPRRIMWEPLPAKSGAHPHYRDFGSDVALAISESPVWRRTRKVVAEANDISVLFARMLQSLL